MAIKVGGTTVIDDSRNVSNIGTIKGLTYPGTDGTSGQFLKTDGSGTLSFETVQTDPTLATLTKSFISGETATITLSSAIPTAPVVSVIKEVPQTGVSSKGAWDVATDAANYDRYDTAYDTTLTPAVQGWDISTTTFVQNFSVSAQEAGPTGVFFKPDGTVMYTIGNSGQEVNQFNLSTAWNLSTASPAGTYKVNSQETLPSGLFFKPDGTKMYVIGQAGNDVNEYNLSTAWVVNTASFVQSRALSVSAPTDVFFKPDGTKMYTVEEGGDQVDEYNLSTAWNVSTTSLVRSFSVSAQDSQPSGVHFRSDGSKMYVLGASSDSVHEYNLSTPWDISTASLLQSFSVAAQDSIPTGLTFKPDGTKMYVVGGSGVDVNEYDLEAYNVLTLGSGSFASGDVGRQIEGNGGKAILTATDGSYSLVTAFNDNSTIAAGDWSMFGAVANDSNGLKLSNLVNGFVSPNNWTYGGTSLYLETTNITNPIASNGLTSNRFGKDGTRLYVSTFAEDRVWQINLSTPYDITTASFDSTLYVASENTTPYHVFFKPDGTKMFMLGILNATVYQYSLSTPWELSTASYDSISFVIPSQNQSPAKLFFKPDGTKLFVSSSGGDHIQELSLSTPWDITTMSSVFKYSITAVSTSPRGIYIKDDGLTYFLITADLDRLYEFNMSTAWDISTSSYSGNFISIRDTANAGIEPEDIDFKPDGTIAIIGDQGGAAYVREWSTGSLFTPVGTYEIAVTNAGGKIDTTTWFDINAMTADESVGNGSVSYAVSTDGRTTWSVIKDADGVRPIVRNNAGTWEYNSNATYGSTTWTAATTNEELSSLQQALTDQAQNRMDNTQISAVTDPNHFTLGDSLDLMVGLYQASASASVPSSDGVSINYDAEALQQGAALGVDYNFDAPDSTTVRVTSNATQNLKIRVV